MFCYAVRDGGVLHLFNLNPLRSDSYVRGMAAA